MTKVVFDLLEEKSSFLFLENINFSANNLNLSMRAYSVQQNLPQFLEGFLEVTHWGVGAPPSGFEQE